MENVWYKWFECLASPCEVLGWTKKETETPLVGENEKASSGYGSNGKVDFSPVPECQNMRKHPELFEKAYEMKEIIGYGSSSKCFKCVRRRDGQIFAVKVINFASLSLQYPSKALKRLHREVQSLQILDHESIVHMEDFFCNGDQLYIVEEFLSGGELYDRIVSMNGIREDHARCIFFQIASAVSHMHKRNIMHRDIKPENVLFQDSTSLKVKLIDFGFSKALRGASHASSFLGTGGFLAPELRLSQLSSSSGSHYTKAVDIWALGCLLYVMVSGRMPFDDSLYSRPKSEFRVRFLPDRVWNYASSDLKDLIRKMLEPEPLRRLTIGEVIRHGWLAPIREAIKPMPRSSSLVDFVEPAAEIPTIVVSKKSTTPFCAEQEDQKAPDGDEDMIRHAVHRGKKSSIRDMYSIHLGWLEENKSAETLTPGILSS